MTMTIGLEKYNNDNRPSSCSVANKMGHRDLSKRKSNGCRLLTPASLSLPLSLEIATLQQLGLLSWSYK